MRIEPSGHEFLTEDKETILAAALRNGIVLPYSCRNGACGTCKGKLLSGTVDYGVYEERALSNEEKAAGKALFCQALPMEDVVIEARELTVGKDIVIKILPCRVVNTNKLAHDVMGLQLKLPQNKHLNYLAGQYIDILLPGGKRRSFSLARPPQNDEFLELQIRHVRGGRFTGHVFDTLKEKDLLRFQGPFGIFYLREDSHLPIILMAGGTGFSPIKAIIEHAFATNITRPMHLFWGVRAKRDLYMHKLAREWVQAHANFRYTPVLSESRAEDQWQGRIGWVHEAVVQDYPDLSRHEIYAAGPPPMIVAGRTLFLSHGLDPEHFYSDSFEFSHDH